MFISGSENKFEFEYGRLQNQVNKQMKRGNKK